MPQETLVLLLKRWILRGIDPFEIAQMLILPTISLDPVFFYQLIPFLLGLPSLLTCQGPFKQLSLLEIKRIILDLVRDIHQVQRVSD